MSEEENHTCKKVASKFKHYPNKYRQLMHFRPKKAKAMVIIGWKPQAVLEDKTMDII